MRGSLRLRHSRGCPANADGKHRDSRACRCSPAVEVRFSSLGIDRKVGYLTRGWRAEDLAEFERERLDMRQQILAGQPVRPKRVLTLNDYAVGWFEQLHAAVTLGQLSPLTYNQYEGDWRRWLGPRFGKLPLGAIDVAAANAYIADRLEGGAAESTAKNSLTCLSGMLTDAAAEGLIAANPLRSPRRGRHGSRRIGVDLKVHRKPPKHLELDEALALLAVTPDEYVAMPLAAMTHGLRRNELLGVHFEWIDWGSRTLDLRGQLQWVRGRPRTGWEIRDCKFKSNRLLPLYSGFAALVGRRRQAEGLVFTPLGGDGRPWGETKPAQVFLTDAYEAAGLRRPGVLWHSLRHTYASLLGAGGIKQHEIELLMGHKVAGTTGLYLHVMRETFDNVETILDQAFGAALRARFDSESQPSRDGSADSGPTARARRF
jgi:integrase